MGNSSGDETRRSVKIDEANGPIAIQFQRACHDTLLWLISVSLGVMKAKYLCLALLVVCASCHRSQPSAQGPTQLVVSPHTDTNSPRGRAALAFAHALTDGDFAAAHNQLSASLKSSVSPEELKKNYEEMIGAYDSPPSLVDLTTTMDVWPGKQQNDIEWAYVTIAGKDWAEAVTL
jgi:hypothetical protein